MSKSLVKVFNTIRDFNHQIKRQYSLIIYKIKYNNNRLVIIINREIAYKLWVKEESIKLKLSLTYTYKPSRGTKYIE